MEAAEAAVRVALNVGPTENMRVRVMSRAGDAALATLELDASRVEEVAVGGDAFDVVSAELGKRGMWLSDVRAFESGSVAKRSVAEEAAGDDDDTAGDDGGGKVAWSSLFLWFAPSVASFGAAPGPLERWDAEQCEIALAGGDPFVVSFGTTWCGPCHVLEPELETLAKFTWEFDDSIAVAKLDAEASPAEDGVGGKARRGRVPDDGLDAARAGGAQGRGRATRRRAGAAHRFARHGWRSRGGGARDASGDVRAGAPGALLMSHIQISRYKQTR